jgi:glycosyltransferase involved in cell wall biosynthesis
MKESNAQNKPKKVLYVITKANWGGAQKYVFDLATAAKERGYDVAVVYGEEGLLVARLATAGIRTIQVPALKRDVSGFGELRALFALTRLFKKEHPDVVHLNSSKAGFTGARAARSAKVPNIIFTAHGWAFTEPRRPHIQEVFKLLQKQTALQVDTVIAVSDYVAAAAREWNLPANKLKTIRLGIREPEYLSKELARAALITLDPSLEGVNKTLWVGTIAELHKNKGLDIGIAGWRKAALPQGQWAILGGGEEENFLHQLAEGDDSIHLLGFVPDAAKYVKAFDLFLLPSRTEALAYVILEAGLAGVPVLTNGVGGTREAVDAEHSPARAFFEPENPDSLAKMLKISVQDPVDLKKIGENLSQFVRTKFSFDKMIEETFALY